MKQFLKTAGPMLLLSATAMAQSGIGNVQGQSVNPVNVMWWVFTVIYGIFGAAIATAILYHCLHGALGTHDGFGKIFNVLMYGGIGFAAVFIVSRMTLGAQAPIQMIRPTPLALNRPMLIFGFPPKALTMICVGLAVGIIASPSKLLVAVLAAIALVITKRCAKDPIGLLIFWRAMFQKAQYVPTMRKVFRMEIKP